MILFYKKSTLYHYFKLMQLMDFRKKFTGLCYNQNFVSINT